MPSTPANDLPASASFSARKPLHVFRRLRLRFFSNLAPFIYRRLLRLATKDYSNRLLVLQPTVLSLIQAECYLSDCRQRGRAIASRVALNLCSGAFRLTFLLLINECPSSAPPIALSRFLPA